MTNTTAVILGLLIIGAIALDVVVFGSANILFLGKKFLALLHWLAFWH